MIIMCYNNKDIIFYYSYANTIDMKNYHCNWTSFATTYVGPYKSRVIYMGHTPCVGEYIYLV